MVSPTLGVALRPGLERVISDVIAAVGAEVPAYSLAADEGVQQALRTGVRVALERLMDLLGADQPALGPAAAVYERIGAAEYREQRPLEAVLAAYRVGALVTWRGLSGLSLAAGADAEQTARLAEACFAYIDEIASVSAAGYAQAQSSDAARREALRSALVEAIVDPGPGTQVQTLADQLGWRVPSTATVAVWPGGEAPARVMAAPRGGLMVAVLGEEAAVLARRLGALNASLGTSQPIAEAPASYSHALTLHRLRGTAFPSDGPLVAEDHLPELLLASDERLASALVEACLAPLADMEPARRDVLVDTACAWLSHGGSRAAVAQDLHIHPQTVAYRMEGIRDALGSQLMAAEDRWRLLLALRAEQMLRLSR